MTQRFNRLRPLALSLTLAATAATALALPSSNVYAFEFPGTSARSQLPNFVELVEKYGPGVVNISTVRQARTVGAEDGSPFEGLDERHAEILRRFGFPMMPFGGQRQEPERRGTGSGFIISADGLILTNHHVVDGADEIKVRLTDDREFTGKVLGSDAKTDIAVVKIEAKDLPALKMGNSDSIKVGEWVAAIGSPFGLENTVTSGIVSAKSRKLPSDQYVPFIQTDVAVNPGNSGGPLFNMDGEVVGINSQIFSTSGGFMGLSFAIPINIALQIKDQLVKNGKVTRGRIGVIIQDVSPELAESFGLKTPHGAIVSKVEKDGPADKGGLKEGDVIIGMNGTDIKKSGDMPMAVGGMAPGSKAKFKVVRDGKTIDVNVTVGASEGSDDAAPAAKNKPVTADKLGLSVRPMTDEEKEKAGTNGVLVTKSGKPANEAGIREGDIIVNVNGRRIEAPSDINRAVGSSKVVRLLVQRRDGTRLFMPLRLK